MSDTTPATSPADAVRAVAGDEKALLALWHREHTRSLWQDTLDKADTTDDPENTRRIAAGAIAEVADSTPLHALAANAELVTLLTGRRWFVMRDAREQGSSWDEIGAALGISGDDARAYYERKIELQELHVGDLHDAARARRALDD
ncbi:hypothetical protein [Kitasatospora sp. NPDC056181]|uniref:hypothetical protein n=1 Tax=Kitasatospora sp. NPDC056181 TaxID=3345737 RepID=UPI0035D71068